ncbi:paired amphipathic helix protein SIN3 [Ceratobasidium sp. AG-Ba]|nr:paired amphipathic helix protein SIN3 [Ceratobasidium sp. AG-Ba]
MDYQPPSTSLPPSAPHSSTSHGSLTLSSLSSPNTANRPTLIRIDMDDLMLHMRAIFQSHEALFDEFCSFLPREEEAAPEQPMACASCCHQRSNPSSDVYDRFLALISSVDRGQLAVPEMYSQICTLFRGDAELLAEFESFFQGEWASDEHMEPYLDNVDESDELDEDALPSITSSPSPSVESFAGTQTPIDSGSPLMSRSMNLKNSSGNGYDYQLQGIWLRESGTHDPPSSFFSWTF